MLKSRVRQGGWEGIEDFVDPVERVSAPFYGVEPDELWSRAAAQEHIHAAKVPVLVLHPEDDEVIPVDHARMLADAAAAQSSFASGSCPAEATARSTPSIATGSTPSCGVSSSGGQGTRAGTAPAMSARTARGPS